MPAVSLYVANSVLDAWLLGNAPTLPSSWFLALYTTNPTSADTGTEVSFSGGTNYNRQPIAFTSPSSGASSNTTDISFDIAGISWGTITHAAIRDAATAGNLLFFGALNTPAIVSPGNVLQFLTGNVTVAVS